MATGQTFGQPRSVSAPARAEPLGDEDLAKIAPARQGADADLPVLGPTTFQSAGELLPPDELGHAPGGPLSGYGSGFRAIEVGDPDQDQPHEIRVTVTHPA